MEKRLNKRGISQVVTTLLFVLIALGAVLLVWTLVRGTITTSSDQIKVDEACLKLELEVVSCSLDVAGNPTVTYKRGNKDPGLTVADVRLVFTDANGESTSVQNNVIPGALETKSTGVIATITNPVEVSAAGVLTSESGNDSPCQLSKAVKCLAP